MKKTYDLSTPEKIHEFENMIWDLCKDGTEEGFNEAFSYFDDNCEFFEIMYTIVHSLETYPIKKYILNLIKKIPYGLKHTPFWTEVLVSRVLNDEKYTKLFLNFLRELSKNDFEKLLKLLETESPHHKKLIDSLRY